MSTYRRVISPVWWESPRSHWVPHSGLLSPRYHHPPLVPIPSERTWRKKKHVERLGLKVAYHRNHGMYIYICVCACVIIYIIYICATTWYLVGLKLWHTMVYPDTPSMAILMILRESDVWTKDFFNTGDKGHHIWLKMRLRNRFEIC